MTAVAKEVEIVWHRIGKLEAIPKQGARVVKIEGRDIAVFRNIHDEIFALDDRCPHKGGPLSQGMVHGKRVTCPLHSWVIELTSGEAVAPDVGCAKPHAIKIENGEVFLAVDRG